MRSPLQNAFSLCLIRKNPSPRWVTDLQTQSFLFYEARLSWEAELCKHKMNPPLSLNILSWNRKYCIPLTNGCQICKMAAQADGYASFSMFRSFNVTNSLIEVLGQHLEIISIISWVLNALNELCRDGAYWTQTFLSWWQLMAASAKDEDMALI